MPVCVLTETETMKPPDDVTDSVLLSLVAGVGPRLRQALLEAFQSPTAILDAAPSQLRAVQGIGAKLSDTIARARTEIDVAAEIELCRRHDVRILTLSDDEYPRMLREIPDPPGVLYMRGGFAPPDSMAVAMVGSRHATRYGLEQAERLAASLARAGLTIVSGLARGIDAAAHRGALSVGGRTLAVLGSGLLNIYPPEHRQLAVDMAGAGALLSEAPLRAQPVSGAFPQRNRLISGLSLGVIVVEASERSGALITARHAMEQNREVFAVPGRVDNRMARGCHRLIRDGARLVETADDVLEELGPLVEATQATDGRSVRHPAELVLNDIERRVLDAVETDTTPVDAIVSATGLPTTQVLSTLTILEMRRLVRRVSGFAFVRL